MAWWQLTVHASTADIDMVEEALLALGAQAITLADAQDEPIYEPLPGHAPVWSQSLVTGLFDQTHSLEMLYDQLVKSLPNHLASTITQQLLKDQVWERTYLEHFKPTVFGDNLWIIPSWHKPVDEHAVNITLDPGLAFGTGSHPTTALCLEWLDQNPPNNKSVIDFGCGSGILGIAAILLNAKSVLFTDIDPQALDATLLNAQRNELDEALIELKLPHEMSTTPVDVVVANILSGPLVELEEHLASLVKIDGHILLSGILPEQIDDIMSAYGKHFHCEPATIKDNWVRITGQRK